MLKRRNKDMVVCIIITALFFILFMLAMIDYIREDDDSDNLKISLEVANGGFMLFIAALIITLGLCANAANKKVLYTDMANNPQSYSINDLKDAHKSIICHKVRQGHWTSFYNGYEFPEINVDVMNSVDQTIHIVK